MHRDELGGAAGASIRFDNVGDTIEGRIAYVGGWEERTDDRGASYTVLRVSVELGGDEPGVLWVRRGSNMASAIGKALGDADVEQLEPGQTIKIRFEDELDTGKRDPLKRYRAKITPAPRKPAGAAAQSFTGDEPF